MFKNRNFHKKIEMMFKNLNFDEISKKQKFRNCLHSITPKHEKYAKNALIVFYVLFGGAKWCTFFVLIIA